MNSRAMVKLQAGGSLHGSSMNDEQKHDETYYTPDLKIWSPFRMCGFVSSFIGLTLTVVAICNNYWIQGTGFNAGIWQSCFYNVTKTEILETCLDKKPYWQNAVIGLLLFSVAFASLAAVLSVCGMVALKFSRKIYYYHSAGEIYFICAFTTAAALVIYPIALEVDSRMSDHHYGAGFALGWGAAIFYLAAALCLSMDDIVRGFARFFCPADDDRL